MPAFGEDGAHVLRLEQELDKIKSAVLVEGDQSFLDRPLLTAELLPEDGNRLPGSGQLLVQLLRPEVEGRELVADELPAEDDELERGQEK